MRNPKNRFKDALKAGKPQVGLWNSIAGYSVAELLGGAGYDWVLVDAEHSAIETIDILPALQALAGTPESSALVRLAGNDPILFKRVLDMGAQTIMVPFIQSRSEAEAAVAAMRYGPSGIRGMAGMTRATRYGKVENYFKEAQEELCLVLQVESVAGLTALEDIATVEGVDGIFIGPADLSASMGYPGELEHPEVEAAIADAFDRLRAIDMPVGIMCLNVPAAKRWIERGSSITAVGVDLVMLADSVAALRAEF